jgi:hypothetical protein
MELTNGKTITFDLTKFTRKEYFDALADEKAFDTNVLMLMSKASGLSLEEIDELSWIDWQAFQKRFWSLVRDPLSDPNSQSAST